MLTKPGSSSAHKDEFRHKLPYPISINYKRIGACPEDNPNRLMYILKTSEMVVRMLGIIALAELRRAFGHAAVPDGAFKKEFKSRFSKPTYGTWMWILRESLKLLRQTPAEPLLAELYGFCFTQWDKQTENIAILDELLMVRNRFIHDKMPQDEWLQPREIPQVCQRALPSLEQVLTHLLFFAKYPIVFVDPITVEKKRDRDPTYKRATYTIAGCSDQFDAEIDISDRLCESGEVLLLDPQTHRYLNLDPFILYSSEGTEERTSLAGQKVRVSTEIKDVFLYNGTAGTGYAYFACNKGGELKSGQTRMADYLDKGFLDLFRLFGDQAWGLS